MNAKCQKCGAELDCSKFKFCPNCGNVLTNINVKESKGKDCKRQRPCDTFEKFKARKSDQRATFFRGKTKKNNPKNDDVLINIGIMKYDHNSVDPSNIYTPIRGKSLPLKINKHANYPQLLTAAIIKRKAYDQSFNEKQKWDIVYPDGKIASSLPGQQDSPFCLSDYKEDLGKNYSRIILYLCTQNSLENTIENNERVEEETFDHTGTASSVADERAKFQPVDIDLLKKEGE